MPNPGQELSTIDFESMIGGPLVAVVNAQSQAAISSVNFIKEVGFKKVSTDQDPEAAEVGDPIYVKFKYPKEVAPYQPAVGPGDGSLDITLAAGGSGYTSAPAVTIGAPPAGGTQAAATTAVDSAGTVTSITLTNPGAGYTTVPAVTIAPPPPGGTQATAAVIVNTPSVSAQIEEMILEVPFLTLLPIPFIRVDETTIDFNAKINSVEYRKTDTNLKISAALEAKAGWLWGSAKLKVASSYQRSTTQGINVERTYSLVIHVRAVQDELPAGMEKILGILEDAIRAQPLKAPAPVVV